MVVTDMNNEVNEQQVGVLYTDVEIEDILYEDNDSIEDLDAIAGAVAVALEHADATFRKILKEGYTNINSARFNTGR
jgi:hypothetical protein